MNNQLSNRQMLRELLKVERPLVMPDAYDALSARLIQMAGFKAVQCSGFSMGLASQAALEKDVDLNRNLATTRDIVQAVTIPVMADGEDGFGPPSTVYDTVGAFLDVGVSGINLEDQILRKGTSLLYRRPFAGAVEMKVNNGLTGRRANPVMYQHFEYSELQQDELKEERYV